MKRQLEYEAPDGGGILSDFDNDGLSKYELSTRPEDAEAGDGVVLTLNREACLAFARLFAQLAERSGDHIHLGYTEDEPQGPGFRIVVDERGRAS